MSDADAIACCVSGCTGHAVIVTGSAEPGQPVPAPSRPFCADHAEDVLHPAYVRGYTSDGGVMVVRGVDQ